MTRLSPAQPPVYSVVVGNVGTVYTGPSIRRSAGIFRAYVSASRSRDGRAAGEPVTVFRDGEIIRDYTPRPILPKVGELVRLVRAIRRDISPEYRAFEGDDVPGIQLTVGCDTATGAWSFQTGDNSFSGGAYHYPHWGVVGVYRRGSARDIARDIRNQLADAHYSAIG